MSGPSGVELDAPLAPVNKGIRLVDVARDSLRDAILSGRVRPGAALSVPELSRQLGISRSPVREAIVQLVMEGLAFEQPRVGAVVATLNRRDVRELYEIRGVLEGLAARLAASDIDEDTVSRMRSCAEAQRLAVQEGRTDDYIAEDLKFHRLLHQASKSRHLQEALQSFGRKIHLSMHAVSHISVGRNSDAVAEHEEILQALETGDGVAAEVAIQRHTRRALTTFLACDQRPEGESVSSSV